jgi:hypothetical protein
LALPFIQGDKMKSRIKFLKDAYVDGKHEFKKGEIVELEESSANRWLKRGVADLHEGDIKKEEKKEEPKKEEKKEEPKKEEEKPSKKSRSKKAKKEEESKEEEKL